MLSELIIVVSGTILLLIAYLRSVGIMMNDWLLIVGMIQFGFAVIHWFLN
jgi:hypothetical protein